MFGIKMIAISRLRFLNLIILLYISLSNTLASGEVTGATGGDIGGGGNGIGTFNIFALHDGTNPLLRQEPHKTVSELINFQKQLIGVDALHENEILGKNQGIAIIDSGISKASSVTNAVTYFKDYTDECGDDLCDGHSHGTIVASLIHQVAPEAKLVVLKVLNSSNKGTIENVIKAMKWVLRNRNRHSIKVINLSLQAKNYINGRWNEGDKLRELIDEAHEKGITVVAAVGNHSTRNRQVRVLPANAEKAITVGSFAHAHSLNNEDHVISQFTNIGRSHVPQTRRSLFGLRTERIHVPGVGTSLLKPDILAPGESLLAEIDLQSNFADEVRLSKEMKSAESFDDVFRIYQELQHSFSEVTQIVLSSGMLDNEKRREAVLRLSKGELIDENQALVNGTSFAAALVSGGICLLKEAKPDLSHEHILQLIRETSIAPFVIDGQQTNRGAVQFDRAYEMLKAKD